MSDTLCEQNVWDSGYEAYVLAAAAAGDPLRLWIEKHFRGRAGGSCLELGCFPGRYLAVFGELGFELNGIDLTPRTDVDLAPWLTAMGHKVGGIVRDDFFKHRHGRTYDVVCSFGVIEHFANWPEFLALQASLVAPGGTIVISAPNFRGGLQHALHRWFDRRNLDRHCLDAMRPDAWAAQLAAEGWSIVEQGGLGRFDFWVETARRGLGGRAALAVAESLRKPAACILPSDTLWCCPYLRFIARRPVGAEASCK